MQAQYLVLSVSQTRGVSNRVTDSNPTGASRDYVISVATVLQPIELVNSEKRKMTGGGFQAIEIPIQQDNYPHIEALFNSQFDNAPVPMLCDLSMRQGSRLQINSAQLVKSDLATKMGLVATDKKAA